jgi:hypothetical protein
MAVGEVLFLSLCERLDITEGPDYLLDTRLIERADLLAVSESVSNGLCATRNYLARVYFIVSDPMERCSQF